MFVWPLARTYLWDRLGHCAGHAVEAGPLLGKGVGLRLRQATCHNPIGGQFDYRKQTRGFHLASKGRRTDGLYVQHGMNVKRPLGILVQIDAGEQHSTAVEQWIGAQCLLLDRLLLGVANSIDPKPTSLKVAPNAAIIVPRVSRQGKMSGVLT